MSESKRVLFGPAPMRDIPQVYEPVLHEAGLDDRVSDGRPANDRRRTLRLPTRLHRQPGGKRTIYPPRHRSRGRKRG